MDLAFVDGAAVLKVPVEHNDRCRRAGMGWDKRRRAWVTPFSVVLGKLIRSHEVLERLQAYERDSLTYCLRSKPLAKLLAPTGLSYKPYQSIGIEYLLSRPSVLLADDMGLGKTIQALGALNQLAPSKVMIICPASVKLTWQRELAKWLVHHRQRVSVAQGSDLDTAADIVIINYDIVHRHEARLKSIAWDVVILDEAQYLKNTKARRTRAVLGGRTINKKGEITLGKTPIAARRKWALTGTPIENRIIEIYPIIKYLSPFAFPLKQRFEQRYCALQIINGHWDNKGASNVDELQEKLRSSVMLRRRKCDVLRDLPPKQKQVICLEPDKATGKLVARQMSRVSDLKVSFRQLAYSGGFGDAALANIRRELGLRKVKPAIEHLEHCIEQSGKVIAFAVHKDVVAALKAHFGARCVVLVGDTSTAKRQAAVDAFQTSDVPLFIGNIKAAGIGITLTASSHVVFIEHDWNPKANEQAEDRAHRIGQTGSVLVQYLVWDESLDAYMVNAIAEKLENIELAMDNLFLL